MISSDGPMNARLNKPKDSGFRKPSEGLETQHVKANCALHNNW
jgi:hypothetical protein